jgi:hypothetical protein
MSRPKMTNECRKAWDALPDALNIAMATDCFRYGWESALEPRSIDKIVCAWSIQTGTALTSKSLDLLVDMISRSEAKAYK